MALQWDFSKASVKKVDELEAKIQDRLDKRSAFDHEISNYQAQIVELNKKI